MFGGIVVKRKRIIKKFLSLVLVCTMVTPYAFASSDTSDHTNEIYYEWVQDYVENPDSSYNYDTSGEYIPYVNKDCSSSASTISRDLANTICKNNNMWKVKDYYSNISVFESDWNYSLRADYNTEQSDIAIFAGHGRPLGFQVPGQQNDPFVTQYDVKFGRNDLDWVFLFTCNWFLYDQRAYDGDVLDGAFGVFGYASTMYMDSRMGRYLGNLLTHGYTISNAWKKMNSLYSGPNTSESNPTIAYSYMLKGHENDHIWDEGSVSSVRGTGRNKGIVVSSLRITKPTPAVPIETY